MSFTLSPVFRDDLILQANKPIRVFGKGVGSITVSLQGTAVTISANGAWLATLPPMPYGGPYTLTVSDGTDTVCCRNVLLGDVLLLAGQSNMQFSLQNSTTDKPTYPDDPDLRLFVPGRATQDEPYAEPIGWTRCTKEAALQWSAIGYFLGNRLRKLRGHAIGLIGAHQGASVIESWMPPEALTPPEFHLSPEERYYDHDCPDFFFNKHSYLWEHLSPQICPLSFERVIWYQGESDTTVAEAKVYDRMLEAMIRTWRARFQDETLPFTVIVIADFDDPRGGEGWVALQQAQRRITSLTHHVTVIESADVCERDAIHPATKSRLAERIAHEGM